MQNSKPNQIYLQKSLKPPSFLNINLVKFEPLKSEKSKSLKINFSKILQNKIINLQLSPPSKSANFTIFPWVKPAKFIKTPPQILEKSATYYQKYSVF